MTSILSKTDVAGKQEKLLNFEQECQKRNRVGFNPSLFDQV